MTLSVIITHHRTPDLLKSCIESVTKAIKNIDGEIIVVDSESQKETQEGIIKNYPNIKFLPFLENVGYSKLVNRGIKTSQGKYLLIINADIVLDSSIHELIHYMDLNPEAGLVGPRLLNVDGTHQPSCFKFYSPWTILCRRTFLGKTPWGKKELTRFLMTKELEAVLRQAQDPERSRGKGRKLESGLPVDWLMGSALLARREATKGIGLLDDRFFMYFEDVDWCRRFWQNDYRVVYFPKVTFSHHHQRASRKRGGILDAFLNKQTRIHIQSAVKYFLKHGLK